MESLRLDDINVTLYEGNHIRIGEFKDNDFIVHFGWYSFAGNREVCGWYLESQDKKIRPLMKTDIPDIYMIRR